MSKEGKSAYALVTTTGKIENFTIAINKGELSIKDLAIKINIYKSR